MNALIDWLSKLVQGVKVWVVVKPWERCARVRWGKRVDVLGPGFHWRIPIADEVMLYNNRLRITSFPGQTLTTADGVTVSVAGNVGFRIDDPKRAMMALQQPESSCAALVQACVAAYVRDIACDEIDAAQIEALAKETLEHIADGLAIEHVSITEFARVNRTYRLLGNEWRPETRPDAHDKE